MTSRRPRRQEIAPPPAEMDLHWGLLSDGRVFLYALIQSWDSCERGNHEPKLYALRLGDGGRRRGSRLSPMERNIERAVAGMAVDDISELTFG